MDLYRYAPIRVGVLNPLIRTVFRSKARRAVRRMRSSPVDSERIRAWFAERTVFFVFAVPRAGSMFLADMLNELERDTIVLHEPNVNDYYYYHVAMGDEAAAREYVAHYRIAEIVERMAHFPSNTYGEINPFLRRHAAALRSLLPDAQMVHLVRDGRKVVRSLASREHFDVNDPMRKMKLPPEDDPYAAGWSQMSRFEKLCWLWQADNRYMRQHTHRTIHFEKLVDDYGYFRDQVLAPFDLEMTEEAWRSRRGRTRNRTPRYRLPPYEQWSRDQKRTFSRICAEEMEACGYRL